MPNYIPQQLENTGNYVQQTPIFDVQSLYESDVSSPEFKELLVRLYQQVNNVTQVLNLKASGYHLAQEFANGKYFFPTVGQDQLTLRQNFTTTVNTGQLPNTGVINIPHNIPNMSSLYTATVIYGAATDPTGPTWISLPYASPVLANNIQVDVGPVNVTITTGSNRTNFTRSIIIIEYLKN